MIDFSIYPLIKRLGHPEFISGSYEKALISKLNRFPFRRSRPKDSFGETSLPAQSRYGIGRFGMTLSYSETNKIESLKIYRLGLDISKLSCRSASWRRDI